MASFTCTTRPLISFYVLTIFLSFSIRTFSFVHHEVISDPNRDFIKASCKETLYPKLCFKTLSSYANSINSSSTALANVALNVSLKGARSTSETVLNLSRTHNLGPREASAISDCVETIGDSVDELQQSLVEMKDLEGPDFQMKMSNILTWVSAALTNENTCMEGFDAKAMDEKLKSKIRKCIVNVAQLTSNALALINRLSSAQVYSP
ncbi:Pectinesterase inhibitor domain [Dillenia turbinata]|uniref:Pectinesterase inhibitor domain n=1 Tax=Dillenia turbinata TaxID=194707 RepID=A0AAN8VV35_9MAGN